jgi:hypothetical protein
MLRICGRHLWCIVAHHLSPPGFCTTQVRQWNTASQPWKLFNCENSKHWPLTPLGPSLNLGEREVIS